MTSRLLIFPRVAVHSFFLALYMLRENESP
jgi:hypothetical protein